VTGHLRWITDGSSIEGLRSHSLTYLPLLSIPID
jgi:hypothetical protein